MVNFFNVGCRATVWHASREGTDLGELLQHGKLDGALILVVEDEPLIALDLSSSLRDAGAQVVQAANVESALAAIDAHRCSAAVVDYWLGYETGRAVARRLKEKHVPFLYYSGRALDDFTTGSGAPVISKPAGGREIVGMLRLLLDGKA
jgi:DNA-binding response OmpR family regulator